jgi:hypothetical protein
VSTTAARYQNLSINQTKLSGQCGRLKCCLNYELDTYMDALRVFPDNAEKIKTTQGVAYLQKRDIFKNLMWFSFEKSNTLYPLTIERVNEIVELNKKGVFPEELQAVEVTKKQAVSEKTDFVDVVGQFSLKGLERASKKKKQKSKSNQARPVEGEKPSNQANPNPQQKGNKPQQQGQKPQGNKPQQQGQGQKPQGNKPQQQGQKPAQQGNKPQQGQGQKPQGNKPQQGQGTNPVQPGTKPQQGQKPQGNKPRPQGNNNKPKPQENKPKTDGEAS